MVHEILSQTIMITSFVLVMMLLIEYINVRSRGKWMQKLQTSPGGQVLLASFLGIIPGCLGTYAVVSLYSHNILSFGALVATMIATSGDEAFFMFSMIPKTALILTGIIFLIAVFSGFLINWIFGRNFTLMKSSRHLVVHKEVEECNPPGLKEIRYQIRHISFERAILIGGLLLFIFGLFSGFLEHSHEHSGEDIHHGMDWVQVTFLITSLAALIIVLIVPDHFLREHLWEHIIKKHFLKILLWTFGALLVIHFLLEDLHLEGWLNRNYFILLILAVLVGLIPESGPHLIFVTLFFKGAIPFGILLANSIVQDGHGALPLFAESKRSFLLMKLVNMVIGIAAGVAAWYIQGI